VFSSYDAPVPARPGHPRSGTTAERSLRPGQRISCLRWTAATVTRSAARVHQRFGFGEELGARACTHEAFRPGVAHAAQRVVAQGQVPAGDRGSALEGTTLGKRTRRRMS
jgi:hypothetical protein